MGRFLFLVLVGLVAYIVIKRSLSFKPPQHPTATPPAPPESQSTVRCTVCQVYVPRSEALLSKGLYYCDEHRPQV